MKSFFYKALLLTGLCAVNAEAISLYDTAPSVGLPESHAAKYYAYVRVGYDTNMNASSIDEQASPYANVGIGATFADYESVDKISYRFNLGATRYAKAASNGSSVSSKKMYADCGLTASIVHAFNSRSTYMANLSVTYSPEPEYASGISAARRQGDCLNWSFSNSYNQSIDSRWSWNANGSYSGNLYSETEYQGDNRQYVGGGAGLNYRASELLSYNVNLSYRHDLRNEGYDSDNITATVGFRRSLDPVSSCSASVGVQTKYVHNESLLSPVLNLGYNRRVSEGFSANFYLALSNENVDTYRGVGANYLSDLTWRVGTNCSYTLSPDVSFTFGFSLMRSSYTKGTGRLEDETNMMISPSIGMVYKFTERLRGSINYAYTWYESDRDSGGSDYTRHNISTGLNYTF